MSEAKPDISAQERWEQGSEFHALFDRAGATQHPWGSQAHYLGCGRDALRTVLTEGRIQRGWRRLWVPSFFCQEVVESMLQVGLPIVPYFAGPDEPQADPGRADLRPGDAVLRVNLFGLQTLPPLKGHRRDGVEYIDDHTHDPWSSSAWHSDADWCVVSLRKTMPVPDGGVLWSPLGHELPAEPALTPERQFASLQKFTAMLLKERYLHGDAVEKDFFRMFAVEGERGIGAGAPSAMTSWSRRLMDTMPHETWRQHRRQNHALLSSLLAELHGLKVLPAPSASEGCPFAVVVVFRHAAGRTAVRQALLLDRIYPGSHWPLDTPAIDGIPQVHLDLSRRILTFHCDMRYQEADLHRVARAVRAAIPNLP